MEARRRPQWEKDTASTFPCHMQPNTHNVTHTRHITKLDHEISGMYTPVFGVRIDLKRATLCKLQR